MITSIPSAAQLLKRNFVDYAVEMMQGADAILVQMSPIYRMNHTPGSASLRLWNCSLWCGTLISVPGPH